MLSTILLLGLLCINGVFGHSMMQCAKWNPATQTCAGPTRNRVVSEGQESYKWDNTKPICKDPWINPISNYYSNGPGCPAWAGCPEPMGTYSPGEAFTVMWYARGHANGAGRTVVLYISPPETNSQGADVSLATVMQKEVCRGPFANCGGQNGATVQCTLDCVMPSDTVAGLYTLWWYWDWGAELYASCADINVVASTAPPPVAQTTGISLTTNRLTTNPQTVFTTGIISQVVTTRPLSTQRVTSGGITSNAVTSAEFARTSGIFTEPMCYKKDLAKNEYGPINTPPTCGVQSPNARCYEGQCCSAKGECGPTPREDGTYRVVVDGFEQTVSESFAIAYYCDGASADYRKVPCSAVGSGASANTFAIFTILIAAILSI